MADAASRAEFELIEDALEEWMNKLALVSPTRFARREILWRQQQTWQLDTAKGSYHLTLQER
jgi:hypothetical protein